jgi:AhpD family alkylhydroperoxidase
MPNDVLSEKERELICLAASVGAGCRPCTAYHLKSARAADACGRGIFLAIETALNGRVSATTAIGEWAEECRGSRPEVDAEFRAGMYLMTELMSIATAVAVNSVPDLEAHLAAARKRGAGVEQIRSAIGIARQIRRVAQEKIDLIANRLDECVSLASTDGETTCCGAVQTESPKAAAGPIMGCGCE